VSTLRKDFVYDDFERHLLDTAQFDQAPQDLPARLGLAMGLSIPILVATEVTTNLATLGSAAEVGSTLAPSGIAASLKAAFGVGSTSLLGTAIKGIAIGVLSGSALLGTGHAVASFVSAKQAPVSAVAVQPFRPPTLQARSVQVRSVQPRSTHDGLIGVATAESDAVAAHLVSERPESRPATKPLLGPAVNARLGTAREELTAKGNTEPALDRNAAPATEANTAPAVPDKTNAVGRFPSLGDDVSALYDAPKSSANLPGNVKEKTTEPEINGAELQALRNAALQKTRTLLGQSKAALALAELEQFRRRAGSKHFGVTELLLRIEALANLGRAKEAQADVAIVERLAPASSALRQAQLLARSRFVR
jgi:hypothetical protein